MEYVGFPTVSGSSVPAQPNNSVSAKNIYGSGSLGGNTQISLGGPGGVTISGTQGIWAGASSFAAAPFSVDLQGNLTANNLTLTGYLHAGQAANDINTNPTTVNGNKITGATITSSQIASSTITGSNISGSTITGSNIAASTITATNLSVTNLSAISANLGTVTAGTINGVTITGTTITGGTVQTATSGQRVVLNGGANEIDIYDSAGSVGKILGSSGYLTLDSGVSTGTVATYGKLVVVTPGLSGVMIALGGNTNVTGTFTASGTKSFDIEHPAREGYRLRYVAPEGGEVLVTCRGKGKVSYPQHFIDVAEPGTDQVIEDRKNGTWFASAIRRGYNGFVPEYKGSSPEDWPGK